MNDDIYRFVADTGIRIVLERIPHVRSCSIGVWVTRGSRHEPPEKVGISHFLEHMVFKGTPKRTAREIATSIESVGGTLDAFTSREYTCFHAKVLDEHVELAVDVLSDLLDSPIMSEENLEREKQVVYEEIRNMEDTPEDIIHQLYAKTIWGDGPLGYPLLGTYGTVGSLGRGEVLEYLDHNYIGPNIVVSAAGNFDCKAMLELIKTKFAYLKDRSTAGDERAGSAENQVPQDRPPLVRHMPRDCQQTHLCLGAISFSHADRRRYALLILNNIIGGGMSSRLFQRVREEEALAYVVYSFQQFYLDTGVSGLYLGVEPSQRDRALKVIREEYLKLLEDGIGEEELEHAKYQLKGHLLLGLESTGTRMFRLANFEVNNESYLPVDEVIEKIQSVGTGEIRDVAEVILLPEKLYSVSLGPNHV
ncbi:MAG: insulinase family protein [Candidatus Glassbacteria bacterium]|nr:insulinase family protein [Candidatus Glassbacteria bacterium]